PRQGPPRGEEGPGRSGSGDEGRRLERLRRRRQATDRRDRAGARAGAEGGLTQPGPVPRSFCAGADRTTVGGMVYEMTARVPAPAADVFAWHERAGPLRRLTPPWLPMRVLSEADSLRSGRARLRVGGIELQARHQPTVYEQGRSFGDELVASGAAGRLPAPRWQHLHLFDGDGSTTVLTDRVSTAVPNSVLERLFRYRQTQLCD